MFLKKMILFVGVVGLTSLALKHCPIVLAIVTVVAITNFTEERLGW